MRGGESPRLSSAFAHRIVEQPPSFAGDAGGFLDRRSEAVQFARQVFQRRLNRPTQVPAVICEEQISRYAADDCPCNGRRDCPRVVSHARPPLSTLLQRCISTSSVPRRAGLTRRSGGLSRWLSQQRVNEASAVRSFQLPARGCHRNSKPVGPVEATGPGNERDQAVAAGVGVEGAGAPLVLDDFPASRMSCFFILLYNVGR
jgi:hypothetical protein